MRADLSRVGVRSCGCRVRETIAAPLVDGDQQHMALTVVSTPPRHSSLRELMACGGFFAICQQWPGVPCAEKAAKPSERRSVTTHRIDPIASAFGLGAQR